MEKVDAKILFENWHQNPHLKCLPNRTELSMSYRPSTNYKYQNKPQQISDSFISSKVTGGKTYFTSLKDIIKLKPHS